jgi:uncharacterized protein (TIGR03083 family)
MPTNLDLAAADRAQLVELLESLTPAEWAAPTLCDGWIVRDVAAHVVSYDTLSAVGLVRQFAGSGFSVDRTNQRLIDATRGLTPEELTDHVRAHITPRGLTAWFGGSIGLLDGLVHQQDIRRSLGRPREISAEALVRALPFLVKVGRLVRGPQNARGLTITATDVEWSHGSGPEVTGPGEALIMALAGRPDALDDVSGPGVDTLARRIER